ncbi:unnamed protein product [Clonostachys byssicola]|uniref:Uncharacterized protein n=1 Tax=Clonostachys byssicola TaxID=160290 RepID=A0A9N9UBH1_9HYPO|nr:unnamed protein product [Clonostachys byssicola]
MASPDEGIHLMVCVLDMETETWLSAEDMCRIEADIMASLNARTMGPNAHESNYQDTYENFMIAWDMHDAFFFEGFSCDEGWELPWTWRSVQMRSADDVREYYQQLQILAQQYVEFIRAQNGVVDALLFDVITMRNMMLPFDEEEDERYRQDKLKQFYVGRDDDLQAAFSMQIKILFVLEDNLWILEAWIRRCAEYLSSV